MYKLSLSLLRFSQAIVNYSRFLLLDLLVKSPKIVHVLVDKPFTSTMRYGAERSEGPYGMGD